MICYLNEESLHVLQWAVKRSQDFGFLDRAVGSVGQLFVAHKLMGGVAPAHLLQVVETTRTPAAVFPDDGGGGFGL